MIETRLLNIKSELFLFEALAEYSDYHKDFDFEDDIKWISDQLDSGNNAAWFCAKLTLLRSQPESIELKHIDSEYLGGCSYQSFDDFINCTDSYIQDMADQLISNNLETKQHA